jgi:transcriptional regulator with AAA-type ATPase domain
LHIILINVTLIKIKKKERLMKTITPFDVYEKMRSVLSRNKPYKAHKDKIKREILEAAHLLYPRSITFAKAINLYLGHAIQRADYSEAKEFFWDFCYEDFKNESDSDFFIPYYSLQLEGLYDMVLLSQESSIFKIKNKQIKPTMPKKVGVTKDGNTIYDASYGSIQFTPFQDMSFSWVRDIVDHAQNRGKAVLIVGATGTSKEAVASVIHKLGRGDKTPYVCINCAAFPEGLIDSALFGHEKGSFTGAEAKTEGIIREANNGTLFLDEIGKTSLNFQAKLLRFIETGMFRSVGAGSDTKVDVRVIGAIHPDIIDDDTEFLSDLKYRFGFPYCIKMPTLKERFNEFKGNIFHSIIYNSLNVVLNKMGMRDKIMKFKIADESFKLLEIYEYKGNYRELENILMSAVNSAKRKGRDIIQPEDLSLLRTREAEVEVVKATGENIKLKDIFSHADEVKASIVATKIQEIIDNGRDIKTVLANEYNLEKQILSESQYIQFTRKIEKVTGKKINDFRKP